MPIHSIFHIRYMRLITNFRNAATTNFQTLSNELTVTVHNSPLYTLAYLHVVYHYGCPHSTLSPDYTTH